VESRGDAVRLKKTPGMMQTKSVLSHLRIASASSSLSWKRDARGTRLDTRDTAGKKVYRGRKEGPRRTSPTRSEVKGGKPLRPSPSAEKKAWPQAIGQKDT